MKNKPNYMAFLLFITILACTAVFLFFGFSCYRRIAATERDLQAITAPIIEKQQEIDSANTLFSNKITEVQSNIDYLTQKAQTQSQAGSRERAPVSESDSSQESDPSVFGQSDGTFGSDVDDPVGQSAENSHVVGIDPGHQSEAVDMSALEPDGPSSSTMKAKASTGTQGSYTGIPEYELNLQVSLKLRDILEQRGYRVVMTRTDNETAISNAERAQLVAREGAEIYVRIHANGEDSHTTSGALTMSPSSSNPYVAHLYEQSNRLSRCILDSYCTATGFADLGVQYYDNMTGINWSTVPVTIVEMGFMTHENDDRLMSDDAFRSTMAAGIADGIDAYFE